MSNPVTSDSRGVRVSGEMTIFTAAGLKQPLLDAIQRPRGAGRKSDKAAGPLGMDLSNVTEFDTAGLQLLLLARQEATGRGREFTVCAASNAVREALAMCGATALLADAPAGEALVSEVTL